MVTAFASQLQLVLGQLATDEKSNEITAIPRLIELFCKKGMVITIDAMGALSQGNAMHVPKLVGWKKQGTGRASAGLE